MPKFYISITVSVDAEDFDDAHDKADDIVDFIESDAPFAYDTNHWYVEQEEFGEGE